MSDGGVNLQAQVESVLGALVKAATVELTKLFESKYRASAPDVDVGRTEDEKEIKTLETLRSLSTGGTKRSVGVQVDGDIHPPLELCAPPLLSDGDCSRECKEKEGCRSPSEIFLTEDKGQDDLMKEQNVPETVDTVDMVEFSGFKEESPAKSDPQTEVVLHVSAGTSSETVRQGPTQNSPSKQKPLTIQPDTRDVEKKVKFVCPLILKSESPGSKPDSSEKPVQAEPQQASVSTAKGTAYSPRPSDGAVTPAPVGVWERIQTPKEMKNNLHMKLKLTSLDQKLLLPCEVQLVDVLAVPEPDRKLQGDQKSGWRLPRDLRRHQGLHTGHRICCFAPCENGVWRLQKVVARSRDGYTCSICGKTFRRRKILRRHERFHTGEKPYPCTVCTKTFALRKSLRRHLRFHTGERPHTCTQCSKSFRLRENLKAHLRFHTGEKPFSCSTCGKMFRIMRNLEKHLCEFFVPSFRTIAGL